MYRLTDCSMQRATYATSIPAKAMSLPSNLHTHAERLKLAVNAELEGRLENLATSLNIPNEIQHLKALIEDVISSAKQQLDAVDLQVVTKDVEAALMVLFAKLAAEFPAPESALRHDERVAMMSDVMTRVRGTILRVGVEHGIAEERLARHLDIMCPKIVVLIVLAGDLAEQHPVLLEGLLLAGTVLIIPEGALLRPLLAVFGFGPLGPVKGSVAAWVQRTFYGAAVPKGSWFSQFQRVAMTFGSIWLKWVVWRV
ncbi:hypothetical protein B0H21DRAFT_743029 [Amylocystis lapponica]|nr:hypothetical protein B0H21DRAFT_743029 [Amylocystis lapponica]